MGPTPTSRSTTLPTTTGRAGTRSSSVRSQWLWTCSDSTRRTDRDRPTGRDWPLLAWAPGRSGWRRLPDQGLSLPPATSGEYPAKPGEGGHASVPRHRGRREACFVGWGAGEYPAKPREGGRVLPEAGSSAGAQDLDLHSCLVGGRPRREGGRGRVGDDARPAGEAVHPLPAVAHPDDARRHAVRDERASSHAAAVVEDADQVSFADAAVGGIVRADPEPRLRVGPGHPGEGPTVVVEAMEVRYGAALCEDQRISTRGGGRPVVLARSLIDGERGRAKACRRLRHEFDPARGCREAKVGMAHLRDRERCVCSAL